MTQRRIAMASWLLIVIVVACSETRRAADTASPGGTVVIASTSEPDALFPPIANNMDARQVTELVYEYLADVGPSMNTIGDAGFVKQLASRWAWGRDSMSIAFSIHPGARWHDGRPVSARDVAFSFGVYGDSTLGSPTRNALSGIDSVTVPDPASVVFWFKRRTPNQFYDAAAQMLILPQHVFGEVPRDSLRQLAGSRPPVGSGRYRFGTWTRGSHFDVVAARGHYRGTAGPQRVLWTVTPEYKTALTRLLGGEADVFANIRQETIPDLVAGKRFNMVSLPGMAYAFMTFNTRDKSNQSRPHDLFASREVRRAITMSLDRHAMVKNLFDTLASLSIGPMVRAYPTTDTSVAQIRFDRPGAERLLDSLGWRRTKAGGVRANNGTPFKFEVIVPVSSQSRVRIAPIIQEQLRQAGIEMQIEQMDYNAFDTRQRARSFDAALSSWTLTSSPSSIREAWTSSAAGKHGLNFGAYENPVFDSLVDSALRASTMEASKPFFRRANQVIVDDAPAVWLYEPRTLIAIDRRIRTTAMRPNSWWLDIAGWRIPVSERLPRDQQPGK